MCVGFWTTQHPDYAFIILNNRDEFLARPTLPASVHHFGKTCHHEGDNIISGLDIKGGGTWLGINRHGRIAMLTNITEEARKRNTSRGDLVSDYLLSSTKESMEEHLEALTKEATTEEERLINHDYAGFNLMLISMAEEDHTQEPSDGTAVRRPCMALVTNSEGGGTLTTRWLSDEETKHGGISNGVDGKTMHLWTKVKEGQDALEAVIRNPHHTEEELCEHLFSVLAIHPERPLATRDDLRGALRVDPFDVNIGAGIQGWYGTRVSSIILVRKDGYVLFLERDAWSLGEDGKPVHGSPKNDRKNCFWLYL